MGKNILKIIGIFILGMMGGIFADQIFWPYFIERPLFYQYRLGQNPIYLTEKKEIYIQENVALKNAIEKVEKVVIGVRTKTKGGKILEGTGFIITSDGLVVTLAELVPSGSEFSFFVESGSQQLISGGQILKRDLKENLALIKLAENRHWPTTGFADLEKIKLGERVFLVGVIFEKDSPLKIVNEGIIKSLGQDFIKTNIFEKPILAGSPLFNIEGQILGINTINKEGEIIALPISKIRSFVGF